MKCRQATTTNTRRGGVPSTTPNQRENDNMTTKTIEQVQEDNEILAETNRNCLKEIETLKAQLQDKELVIANLNVEVEAKAEYNYELRNQLDQVISERDENAKALNAKTKESNELYAENKELRRETHDQKLRIEKHEATIIRKRNLKDKADQEITELKAYLESAKQELEYQNELKAENEVIHTALVKAQNENMNLEITVNTLIKLINGGAI